MTITAFAALALALGPVTIEDDKASPAKSTITTTLSARAANRCVKLVPAFQTVAVNEIVNDDGSTDLAVIDALGRAALWTIRPDTGGTVVEGRGRLGNVPKIIEPLRACLNAAPSPGKPATAPL